MGEKQWGRIQSASRQAILVSLGWSQKKLAERLNVSPSMISQLLREKKKTECCRVELVRQIGISYEVFWGTPPEKNGLLELEV